MFWNWFTMSPAATAPEEPLPKRWYVFMIRCADGSLSAAVTHNIEESIKAVNAGQGSAYIRRRRPVFLVYSEEFMNERDAVKRAERIRHLNRRAKEALLSAHLIDALDRQTDLSCT